MNSTKINKYFLLEEKSTINRGDISEGILAAALTARFLVGKDEVSANNSTITINDVWNVIQELNEEDDISQKPLITKKTKTFKSMNEKVESALLTVGLTKNNFAAFTSVEIFESMSGIIDSAIAYASSSVINKIIQQIDKSKKVSTVKIASVGLEAQKKTKADVILSINDNPVLKLSMKAGSTKQLGQVGKGWEKNINAEKSSRGIVDLFRLLFGVEINQKLKAEYVNAIQEGGYDEAVLAIKSVYSDAHDKIAAKFEASMNEGGAEILKEFLITLARGIKYEAVLDEEGITLLHLKNQAFDVLDFNKLEDLVKDENKEIDIEVPPIDIKEGLPKISVHLAVDGKPYGAIISIRPKIRLKETGEIGEFRHYVEKEAGLTNLIRMDLSNEKNGLTQKTAQKENLNVLIDFIKNVIKN